MVVRAPCGGVNLLDGCRWGARLFLLYQVCSTNQPLHESAWCRGVCAFLTLHVFTARPLGIKFEPPDLQAILTVLQAGAKKVLITAPAKVRPAPPHRSSCRHPHWHVVLQMHSSQLLPPASILCILAAVSFQSQCASLPQF